MGGIKNLPAICKGGKTQLSPCQDVMRGSFFATMEKHNHEIKMSFKRPMKYDE